MTMKVCLKLRPPTDSAMPLGSSATSPSDASIRSLPPEHEVAQKIPQLVIDYREAGLIDLLKRNGVVHTTRNLDVGDIVIEVVDQSADDSMVSEGTARTLLVVIERKTLNDLASSIRDGRYREQKARMMATQASRRIYLIETSKIYQFSMDTIESALLNTLIRDGLGVYQTRSSEHTYQTIRSIFEKTCEFLEIVRHGREEINYLKNVGIRKRDNHTPASCFQQQLALIPGVSVQIAEHIVKQYPTMVAIIQEYQLLPEACRPDLLKELSVGQRKLGPVVSHRIYAYIFGLEK